MRKLMLAAAAALALATPASAAIITVTFEIQSDNWMQVTGTEPAYGLPADPFLSGSFDVDDSAGPLAPPSAVSNFALQVGTRLFTEADLLPSSFVAFTTGGQFVYFQFNFSGEETVNQVGGRFNDGTNIYACNGCLTVTSPIYQNPVPEPATWALMIGGFGLAGSALRRGRLSAAT